MPITYFPFTTQINGFELSQGVVVSAGFSHRNVGLASLPEHKCHRTRFSSPIPHGGIRR
jgi:hypothetical protein